MFSVCKLEARDLMMNPMNASKLPNIMNRFFLYVELAYVILLVFYVIGFGYECESNVDIASL